MQGSKVSTVSTAASATTADTIVTAATALQQQPQCTYASSWAISRGYSSPVPLMKAGATVSRLQHEGSSQQLAAAGQQLPHHQQRGVAAGMPDSEGWGLQLQPANQIYIDLLHCRKSSCVYSPVEPQQPPAAVGQLGFVL